jgi:type II secretory pathway predicted ATPase ExeA
MNNQPKYFTSSPLGAFLGRHAISVRKLSDMLGGPGVAGSSTVYRLLECTLDHKYEHELMSKLAEILPPFLMEKGYDKAQIDQELLEVFEKGEYQPMISQRLELSPEAQRFFGFTEDPFCKPPQSREEVFISPALEQIFDRLKDAIRYQGFVSVTGEIGSGKTTLRALLEDYVESQPNIRVVWPEFFDMRNVTPMQIATSILEAFEVARVPRSAIGRGKAVKDLLARLYKDGVRVSLAFDECHRLNDAALSSLKNFFEMSSGGFQRYLGVILFGQPLFEARLREHHFREIFERVVPVRMPDFSDAAAGYLQHRLQLVGGDIGKLFDKEALELICRQSTTPLGLGNLTNEAFLTSMRDFNNQKVIGAAIKTKMFFENPKNQQSWSRRKSA